VVSAVTATVVVTVALVFFVRRDKTAGSSTAPSASALAPSSTAPVAVTTASVPAPPLASAVEPSAADLPYGYGYLTVVTPANANIYLSGKLAGPVNKPLKVRCGQWFIRLATPQEGGRYPDWVSKGETALVPCQASTRIDMSTRKP
jgi:hypothetical protein